MSVCDDIRAALSGFDACTETELGAEIKTHCLYPSFVPVFVYVVRMADSYKVHDGGGAVRSAWDHGRDYKAVANQLAREARRFGLSCDDGVLTAKVTSVEWLSAAVVSVANASAFAVQHVLEKAAVESENLLKERILETLLMVVPHQQIKQDQPIPGRSGRTYPFDFLVEGNKDRLLMLNAVTPHAVSVNSKYVAFSDTDSSEQLGVSKFAVHEKPLAMADESLLLQVATLVPLGNLEMGARRVLINA